MAMTDSEISGRRQNNPAAGAFLDKRRGARQSGEMNQRYDLLAISLLLFTVVFAVWLTAGPMNFALKEWQPLIASFVALGAAALAYKAAMAKVGYDRELASYALQRRPRAPRANLNAQGPATRTSRVVLLGKFLSLAASGIRGFGTWVPSFFDLARRNKAAGLETTAACNRCGAVLWSRAWRSEPCVDRLCLPCRG
jgi:hypothetical protein